MLLIRYKAQAGGPCALGLKREVAEERVDEPATPRRATSVSRGDLAWQERGVALQWLPRRAERKQGSVLLVSRESSLATFQQQTQRPMGGLVSPAKPRGNAGTVGCECTNTERMIANLSRVGPNGLARV